MEVNTVHILTSFFFSSFLLLILDVTAFKPICVILNVIQCYTASDVPLSNISHQTKPLKAPVSLPGNIRKPLLHAPLIAH